MLFTKVSMINLMNHRISPICVTFVHSSVANSFAIEQSATMSGDWLSMATAALRTINLAAISDVDISASLNCKC